LQRHPFWLRAEQSGARNQKDTVESGIKLLKKERTLEDGGGKFTVIEKKLLNNVRLELLHRIRSSQ